MPNESEFKLTLDDLQDMYENAVQRGDTFFDKYITALEEITRLENIISAMENKDEELDDRS